MPGINYDFLGITPGLLGIVKNYSGETRIAWDGPELLWIGQVCSGLTKLLGIDQNCSGPSSEKLGPGVINFMGPPENYL